MSYTFYQTLFPLNARSCVRDEAEHFLIHPLGSSQPTQRRRKDVVKTS